MEDLPLVLRINDLESVLGVPRRTLQRLRTLGLFPRPTQMIGRYPVWHRDIILDFASGQWKPKQPKKSVK